MKLGVLTDVHLSPVGTRPGRWHNDYDFSGLEGRLERALELHREAGVDAIACLGDLANAGDEPSLRRGLLACASAALPVRLVPGNHDCEEGIDRLEAYVTSVAEPALGLACPGGEAIGRGRVAGLPMTATAGSRGWCVAQPDTARWGSDPVVLLCHFPVIGREDAARGAGLLYAGDADNRDTVERVLLARPGPTVVLHGHLHIRDAAARGPLLQIGCGALVEPPYEIALVSVGSNGGEAEVRVRYTAVAASPDVRLPVIAPPASTWRYRNGAWSETAAGDDG